MGVRRDWDGYSEKFCRERREDIFAFSANREEDELECTRARDAGKSDIYYLFSLS